MCNHQEDTYCEKAKLSWKLHKLATANTTVDQHGISYVRVQYIENLIKELECENV